jgi:hypothetical protein
MNKLPKLAFITGFTLISYCTFAQGPGTGGPTPGPPNSPPTDIPIDGGASLLIAGGVAFGLKKLRDRRRKQ